MSEHVNQESDVTKSQQQDPNVDEKHGFTGHGTVGPAPAQNLPPYVIQQEDDANALQRNDTVTTRPSAGGKSGLVIDAERAPEMVTPLQSLGENPTWIDCPFCRKRTMTRTSKEGSSAQTMAGVLCCLFCLCLACVPCLAGWCENINIFCSSCGRRVATIPHDGTIQVHGPTVPIVPSNFPSAPSAT